MQLKYSKHVYEINANFTCEVYFTYYDDRVNIEYHEKGNPNPILMHCLKYEKTLSMKDYARKYLKEFLQKVSPCDLCLVNENA